MSPTTEATDTDGTENDSSTSGRGSVPRATSPSAVIVPVHPSSGPSSSGTMCVPLQDSRLEKFRFGRSSVRQRKKSSTGSASLERRLKSTRG